MNWYIFLYVIATLSLIALLYGVYYWIRSRILPPEDTGGIFVTRRLTLGWKWQIVVIKYRDKEYMLGISDSGITLIDVIEEQQSEPERFPL